jgi:membrane protein required for colicin V production
MHGKYAMNFFDMIITVILGFCLIRGIFRGLVKELASIIGVLAGFYAAYTYYLKINVPFVTRVVSDPGYLNILNFMVIFCVIFIVVSMLGVVIKYVLNIAFLGWLDRICGLGFGFIKGILIVSILLMVLTAFLKKGTPIIKDSLLSPHVSKLSENMAKVVTRELKYNFEINLDEFKQAWRDLGPKTEPPRGR